jgi:hypothetical protein
VTNIRIRFTTPDGSYTGAFHRDYFREDGLARAYKAKSVSEAETILAATYLGADEDGVGLIWSIEEEA